MLHGAPAHPPELHICSVLVEDIYHRVIACRVGVGVADANKRLDPHSVRKSGEFVGVSSWLVYV